MSTTTCPYVLDVERVEKCTFRSHFHPRCIFSRNAEFPLDIYPPDSRFLLYRKECRVTLIRRGGYVVPSFRECDEFRKEYSDTPGCIKFCNVINACLTSRIPVIRRIDKCLKFLFLLSLYIKSGHRTF